MTENEVPAQRLSYKLFSSTNPRKVRISSEVIEELDVEAHLHSLGQGKRHREVEVTPCEIGTAQRVTTEVPELLGSRATLP